MLPTFFPKRFPTICTLSYDEWTYPLHCILTLLTVSFLVENKLFISWHFIVILICKFFDYYNIETISLCSFISWYFYDFLIIIFAFWSVVVLRFLLLIFVVFYNKENELDMLLIKKSPKYLPLNSDFFF